MVQYGKRTYLCELLKGKTTQEQMDAVVSYVLENDVTPYEYGSYYLKDDTYDPHRAGSR